MRDSHLIIVDYAPPWQTRFAEDKANDLAIADEYCIQLIEALGYRKN